MIKIAIAGYGHISRGVEIAIQQNPDMELAAIFTRRPSSVTPCFPVPVIPIDEAPAWANQVDVLILCGGSLTDLPMQGPEMAQHFNTVDCFDTHPEFPAYFAKMDAALNTSEKLGLIASGWDPGLFSLLRLYMPAVLPSGESYTFWGKGISQGHSSAIRQIEGVVNAVSYTCRIQKAVEKVCRGAMPKLSTADKHTRTCYVVLKDRADAGRIEQEILHMPYYFADNKTSVYFISADELAQKHSSTAHKGFVFRSGHTGQGSTHHMEFALTLDSNPEFTAHVLVAYARAVAKMAAEGRKGAVTVFDVAPALLSPLSREQLLAEVL